MIRIPHRTKTILEKNHSHYAFVHACIDKMQHWLGDNKMIFFPEYTDHGITHINDVLLTADSIITDDSWDCMTPQDASAMIVSVLLHDSAMHLTEDGFYSLINNEMPKVTSRFINDERPWGAVWSDYFLEAKRFDTEKLKTIFGDDRPVRPIPDNKIDLSSRDRLLIGEFIRRHHARIAHEIASYGIPGVSGKAIPMPDEPHDNFLDMCGFIARSHNMNLRDAVDRLEKNKKQVHLNAHVPFIMSVLRISDYIQIHSERAPRQLLSLKSITSPISRGEWKKHHSIVEINQAHQDPEAIYIDAEPKNALVYEELKKLFIDIQKELDIIWSVHGEVYGRYQELGALGITIRRVRSSLDKIEHFIATKKPSYIPRVLKFKTADSEMMELLIAPLYGDRPEVGIRELMQNSVDACSELRDYQIKNGLSFDDERAYDVCISLYDNGQNGGSLVIEDNGIGMNLDVIDNYFLNVGASFRNSDVWKKEHQTEGRSNVYRSGRFGIGLLAAYLLGNELSVVTRHVNSEENKGLMFKCQKGSKKIEVSHTNFHIGTKITIELSQNVVKHLQKRRELWDWYALDTPRVVRKVIAEGNESELRQALTFPSSDADLKQTFWNRTKVNEYDDIIWAYEDNKRLHYYRRDRSFVCNGIFVASGVKIPDFAISSKLGVISASTPTINIFDQDGVLPINLERTDIIGSKLSFLDEMAKDVSNYLASKMHLFCQGLDGEVNNNLLSELLHINIPGLSLHGRMMPNVCPFLIRNDGLLPLDFSLLQQEKVDSIFIDAANLSKGKGGWEIAEYFSKEKNYLIVDKISDTKQSRSDFVRYFFEPASTSYLNGSGLSSLPIKSRRFFIKKTDVAELVSPGYIPKTFWNRLECEWENDIWILMALGNPPNIDVDHDKVTNALGKSNSFGFCIYYLDWDLVVEEDCSLFSNSWIAENQAPLFKFK